MTRYLGTAIRMTILTAILLGLLYPLAITGISQVVFPGAANGSLVKVNGRVVGSSLIAQDFTAARYFQPRPSAAGSGYNAMASSASNLGPTSRTLVDRVRADVRAQLAEDPGLRFGAVPVDMVTTSGSGLDPDITVANARAQAPRVAAARGMSLAERAGARVQPHHGPPARLPRRAARQRAEAEPGARRGPGHQGTLMARGPQAEPPAASGRRRTTRRLRTTARRSSRCRRCASAAGSRCSSATRPASARPTRCSPRPTAGRRAARTSSSASSSRTTARRRATSSSASSRCRSRSSSTAARSSRSSTPPPSSRASRRWVLVDELAHTNVPGTTHEKRWQSVEEILAAGIDVLTTVNVQHLESLNDSVFQITGVRVQRDRAGLRRGPRRGGRPGRPHHLRAAQPPATAASSTTSTRSPAPSRTSSRAATCWRCASWRCARRPKRWTTSSRSTSSRSTRPSTPGPPRTASSCASAPASRPRS